MPKSKEAQPIRQRFPAREQRMKQRVLISAALLHDPDVLILDEPLSGIDVSSATLFKHLLTELARKGKMILYISHVLEVVERVCARVVIIYGAIGR